MPKMSVGQARREIINELFDQVWALIEQSTNTPTGRGLHYFFMVYDEQTGRHQFHGNMNMLLTALEMVKGDYERLVEENPDLREREQAAGDVCLNRDRTIRLVREVVDE